MIVGTPIAYLNAAVVAFLAWAIWGRDRLAGVHWPLTIGESLSGATTMAIWYGSMGAPGVLFGAFIGFLTALLFWAIALRNANPPEGHRLAPSNREGGGQPVTKDARVFGDRPRITTVPELRIWWPSANQADASPCCCSASSFRFLACLGQ
jgi:hypothetical protein